MSKYPCYTRRPTRFALAGRLGPCQGLRTGTQLRLLYPDTTAPRHTLLDRRPRELDETVAVQVLLVLLTSSRIMERAPSCEQGVLIGFNDNISILAGTDWFTTRELVVFQ